MKGNSSTPPAEEIPADVVAVAEALSAHLSAEQSPEPEQAAAGAAPPVALLEGTFAIYQDGKGGFVLVTDTVQHGTDRRHIPAAMVKLATGGGIIGRRVAGMFSAG